MTRAEKIEKAANTYAEEICEDCDCVNQVALENFHAALALPADQAPASEVEKAKEAVIRWAVPAFASNDGADDFGARTVNACVELNKAVKHLVSLAALGQEKPCPGPDCKHLHDKGTDPDECANCTIGPDVHAYDVLCRRHGEPQ